MIDMIRSLRRELDGLRRVMPRVRTGVVTDDDPLSVALGGATEPYTSVKALGGQGLSTGDVAACLTFGNDLLVLGPIGPGTRQPINTQTPAYGMSPAATAAANTTGLLLAMSHAHASGRPIHIPTGVYSYNNPVTPAALKNVTIYGDGQGATVLVPTNNTTEFLAFDDADGVTLRDLSIGPMTQHSTRNTATSIAFYDAAGPRIERCEVYNTPSIAVAFVRCTRPLAAANHVHDSLADGIHFLDCDLLHAAFNRVENTEDDSIAVVVSSNAASDAMQGGSVKSNTIDAGGTGNGIRLSAAAGVAVIANQTNNTIGPGIRVGRTAGFGTTTRGCRRIQVIGNTVRNAFPTLAATIAGIEIADLGVTGLPTLSVDRPNEDITVVANTVINSGLQSYEFSNVRGGVFADNIGVDANALATVPYSSCAVVRNCTSVAIGANVMEDRRGTALSAVGLYLSDLTDCVLGAAPVLKGMTDPRVVWAGTLTRVKGGPAVAPTPLNGWVNYDSTPGGYERAGVRVDAGNVVHLQGTVKNGTVPATIFDLDADGLPAPALNRTFVTYSNTGPATIIVYVTGEVVVVAGGNTMLSLDGISFPAAA